MADDRGEDDRADPERSGGTPHAAAAAPRPPSAVPPPFPAEVTCSCGYSRHGRLRDEACPECGASGAGMLDGVPTTSIVPGIVMALLCCQLTGPIAVVFALKANEARLERRWDDARTYRRRSHLFTALSPAPLLIWFAAVALGLL